MFVWNTDYEATKSTSGRRNISTFQDQTVGLVLEDIATDDEGATTHVDVKVITEDGNAYDGRIKQVRIIRQLSQLPEGTTSFIASVVPYGRRGIVLAPPPKTAKVKDIEKAIEARNES